MSRIGRLPVTVPAGVDVKIKGNEVLVKGPKGELKRLFSPQISIKMEGDQVMITRDSDEPKSRSLHGTTRALINNMVTGVSTGYTKVLEVQGVGYRIEKDENGNNITLHVGFSHPVEVEAPDGITFEVETRARKLKIMGYDKEVVGQIAADGVHPLARV